MSSQQRGAATGGDASSLPPPRSFQDMKKRMLNLEDHLRARGHAVNNDSYHYKYFELDIVAEKSMHEIELKILKWNLACQKDMAQFRLVEMQEEHHEANAAAFKEYDQYITQKNAEVARLTTANINLGASNELHLSTIESQQGSITEQASEVQRMRSVIQSHSHNAVEVDVLNRTVVRLEASISEKDHIISRLIAEKEHVKSSFKGDLRKKKAMLREQESFIEEQDRFIEHQETTLAKQKKQMKNLKAGKNDCAEIQNQRMIIGDRDRTIHRLRQELAEGQQGPEGWGEPIAGAARQTQFNNPFGSDWASGPHNSYSSW